MVRHMLYYKGLLEKDWVEAICCANHILIRAPTEAICRLLQKKNGVDRNHTLLT